MKICSVPENLKVAKIRIEIYPYFIVKSVSARITPPLTYL